MLGLVGPDDPRPPGVLVGARLLKLGRDPLYRVRVRVPDAYVRQVRARSGVYGQKALLADVERRARSLELSDVQAVYQDPTDEGAFSVLGRSWQAPTTSRDPYLRISSSERVEEPPPAPQGSALVLDPGLSPEEIHTVRRALLVEENPRHLAGIASTLEPYFPVAASLLRAKGTLLETRNGINAQKLAQANARAAISVARRVEQARPGLGRQVLAWMSGRAHPSSALSTVSRDPHVAAVWRELSISSPSRWYELDRMRDVVRGPAPQKTPAQHLAALEALSRRAGIPMDLLRDEMKRVACLTIEEPESLLQDATEGPNALLDPKKLRRMTSYRFPAEVRDAGRSLVREVGLGIRIVDPNRLKALTSLMSSHREDGFVSPQALQLALAANKPRYSGVEERDEVPSVFKNLNDGTFDGKKVEPERLLRARAQIERANRSIERRRWIDWYARRERAGL